MINYDIGFCRAGVHGTAVCDAGRHVADGSEVSQGCTESVQGDAAALIITKSREFEPNEVLCVIRGLLA